MRGSARLCIYLNKQDEMAAGIRNQGEWRVLHVYPDLSLVKSHHPIRVDEILHSPRHGHLLRGFVCPLSEVMVEAYTRINLHAEEMYTVLHGN